MAKILGVSILSAAGYKLKFDKYFKQFQQTDNYYSMVQCMSHMYKVMREYGDSSFSGSSTYLYEKFRDRVIDCESRLTNSFIVESTPYFQYNDEFFLETRFDQLDDEEKLDYIVWMTRRALLEHLHNNDRRIKSLNGVHLTNECKRTSYLVKDLCRGFGVKAEVVKIPAAFSDEINLYDGSGYHYFVLAEINDKEYLIDCTYRQFFRADNNNLDRLGVVGLCGCDPGVFMLQNRDRKNVALAILKNGWIKCTDETLKHYLDGFTLSFRNGLYYDWLGKVDYSVGYTIDDYMEFLSEDDYITNYEPIEGLGEQETPLTNKGLKFRKK